MADFNDDDFIDELDYEGTQGEGIELEEMVDPGWYHATLDEVKRDNKYHKLTFEFLVLDGPFKDFVVKYQSPDPKFATGDKGQLVARNKRRLLGRRLGLTKESDPPNVSVNWRDAIGVNVYLDVEKRTWKNNDGKEGMAVEPKFDGVYAENDPRVPANVRQGGGEGTAGTGTSDPTSRPAQTSAAARTADDFGSI